MPGYFTLIGFGPEGWGAQLLRATFLTLSVSACAYATGLVFGTFGAWGKLAGPRWVRAIAEAYTTVVRGVPDLLIIYLFYFGGSQVLSAIAHAFGGEGFWGLNGFMVGVLAIGLISGAYQTEVIRGGFRAVPKGEIEAARAVGMGRMLMLFRVVAPRTLRYALPGMGNVWQQVLKESALVSVTGLAEIMRQVQIGAGSTRQPFDFYITGFLLYLLVTTLSGQGFLRAERWTRRSERSA